MKQNITFNNFCDSFEIRKDNFSYEGLRVLYDYLNEFEEDTGTDIELDVIALCCDYCEYSDLNEYLKDMGTDIDKEDYLDEETQEYDEEQYKEDIEEEINNKTTLLKLGDDLNEGFIIQNF